MTSLLELLGNLRNEIQNNTIAKVLPPDQILKIQDNTLSLRGVTLNNMETGIYSCYLRDSKTEITRRWIDHVIAEIPAIEPELFLPEGNLARCVEATILSLFSVTEWEASESETEHSLISDFDSRGELALMWDALPVGWKELRFLIISLKGFLVKDMLRHSIPTHAILRCECALSELTINIIEQRMNTSEEEIFDQRGRFFASQHLSGRFLANTSHDLRTPLTAILGFSELLMEGVYGTVTEEQILALGHIENSAVNLNELINNVIDILRIRMNLFTLKYQSFEIAPMINDIYKILTPLSERSFVEFHVELSDNLGSIDCDEGVVRHIIYFLAASSIRATPKMGEVRLSAHFEGTNLLIRTQDTGLHLPANAIANMTNDFPILENSATRGYEGWEVGLPLIVRYLNLLEGEITIENLDEVGTAFNVLIPRCKPLIIDEKLSKGAVE